jgi:CDP-paratose 2-epimerase
VKCNLERRHYTVFGYKGKQVRDNIHAADVSRFIARFIDSPRAAAVYNIGGGKANSCSILEAFALATERTGRPMEWTYDEKAREGDHICYYSDLRRMQADYPGWGPEITLDETFDQIVDAWERRRAAAATGHAS